MQHKGSNITSLYLLAVVRVGIMDCTLVLSSCCRSFLISLVSLVYDAFASFTSLVFCHVPDADALSALLAVHLLFSLVLVLLHLCCCALLWVCPHHVLHHLGVPHEYRVALANPAPVRLVPIFATSLVFTASLLPTSYFTVDGRDVTALIIRDVTAIFIRDVTANSSFFIFAVDGRSTFSFASFTEMQVLDILSALQHRSCFWRLLLLVPFLETQDWFGPLGHSDWALCIYLN